MHGGSHRSNEGIISGKIRERKWSGEFFSVDKISEHLVREEKSDAFHSDANEIFFAQER